MSEEMKKVNETAASTDTYDREAVEADYRVSWLPHIHNIGQTTLLIGLVLTFIPGVFMRHVMGWDGVPLSSYFEFVTVWIPMLGINQFTEHLRYYPMMGSTTTYIGYLAGNTVGMRLPVAQSCAGEFDESVHSAKGTVAVTIGVATSVVVNIIMLLVIVVAGNGVLAIIPDAVRSALGLITYALFGYLMVVNVRSYGNNHIGAGFVHGWYWILFGIAGKLFFQTVLGSRYYILWTLLVCLGLGILQEYIKDRREAASGTDTVA